MSNLKQSLVDFTKLYNYLQTAAKLNIHLHCLVLDGVYRRGIDGTLAFVEATAPTDEALSKR